MMKSRELAFILIKQLNQELIADAAMEQEKAEIRKEQNHVEVLLTFLWTSEQGRLIAVKLSDILESPHLKH